MASALPHEMALRAQGAQAGRLIPTTKSFLCSGGPRKGTGCDSGHDRPSARGPVREKRVLIVAPLIIL